MRQQIYKKEMSMFGTIEAYGIYNKNIDMTTIELKLIHGQNRVKRLKIDGKTFKEICRAFTKFELEVSK